MSDYRDDRAALRSQNEALAAELAERERELAELRAEREPPQVAVADDAVAFPEKRAPKPIPIERLTAPAKPLSVRVAASLRGSRNLVIVLGLALLLVAAALSSGGLSYGTKAALALVASLAVCGILFFRLGWRTKD